MFTVWVGISHPESSRNLIPAKVEGRYLLEVFRHDFRLVFLNFPGFYFKLFCLHLQSFFLRHFFFIIQLGRVRISCVWNLSRRQCHDDFSAFLRTENRYCYSNAKRVSGVGRWKCSGLETGEGEIVRHGLHVQRESGEGDHMCTYKGGLVLCGDRLDVGRAELRHRHPDVRHASKLDDDSPCTLR